MAITLKSALANAGALGMRLKKMTKGQKEYKLLTVLSDPSKMPQILKDSGLDKFASLQEGKGKYEGTYTLSFSEDQDLNELSVEADNVKIQEANASFIDGNITDDARARLNSL